MRPIEYDMGYDENYGHVPEHLLRMFKRFNVSPADYTILAFTFDKDWDAMRGFIQRNIIPGTRSFNIFGGN